ncbi:WalW protein [Thalassotalea psychrophila]|uniref:WalW protein n=1 Tax=Thalassotalea psychrophila TaxID=3065647 RepID=A0ABY9TUN5_9GAMM|nr:WalW protein [Colwelliaceae bacterium SQ149]
MATNQIAVNILKPILDSNRCELGSHLHPWVNPPLTEQVNVKNSFPGNLDFYLEQEKLKILTEEIEKNYGFRPTTYKAGRYGFGSNTLKILQNLGYKTDLSFCPTLNFKEEGGPDYQEFNCNPSWLDEGKQILEVPVSGAFVGKIKHNSHDIYHLADKFKALKVPSILAKTGLLDRLILSPEGFNHKEHIKLTKYLYKHGHRTFTWSFHSPSLKPGFTPYVQNKQQLTKFLDSFRYYFDFFLNEFGGVASTPAKLHDHFRSLH